MIAKNLMIQNIRIIIEKSEECDPGDLADDLRSEEYFSRDLISSDVARQRFEQLQRRLPSRTGEDFARLPRRGSFLAWVLRTPFKLSHVEGAEGNWSLAPDPRPARPSPPAHVRQERMQSKADLPLLAD
jgi:hypothetical protein